MATLASPAKPAPTLPATATAVTAVDRADDLTLTATVVSAAGALINESMSSQPTGSGNRKRQRKTDNRGRTTKNIKKSKGDILSQTQEDNDSDMDIQEADPRSRCKLCDDVIDTKDSALSAIVCDGCGRSSHVFCLGYDVEFDQTLKDLISIIGWKCHSCKCDELKRIKSLEQDCKTLRTEVSKLKTSYLTITKELNDVKLKLSSQASLPDSLNNMDGFPPLPSGKTNDSGVVDLQIFRGTPRANFPTNSQAIAKVVHNELIIKKQRENNLVVTGLKPSSTVSDKKLFEDLCSGNLNTTPSVNYCRRFGKQITGKVQPLLVVLPSADAAQFILSKAKLLRKSISEEIKLNVFINRHLTRAEVEAEYELREKRRVREGRKKDPTDAAAVIDAPPPSDVGISQPSSAYVKNKSKKDRSIASDSRSNDVITKAGIENNIRNDGEQPSHSAWGH
jgi:hypothetical protein